VRWIVVTHAHLDHAAGAGGLLAACPNATLLAHPRAAKHLIAPAKLIQSASSVYGAEKFAQLYGTIEPIPANRVRALEDGETFELGGATLRVHHTAGHANHHFVVDDPATESVYTGDAYGLVYPMLQARGLFALPSTSPTNFNAAEARKSLDTIVGLGATYACLTHFGPSKELRAIKEQLGVLIDLADEWVTEAASRDEDAETITRRLQIAWRDVLAKESDARGLGFGRDAWALLATDIDLNAQGLASAALQLRNARSKSAT
jgi:glyoxylase-like metal-dependent hydrolase (beta-lactamase superfamily II)